MQNGGPVGTAPEGPRRHGEGEGRTAGRHRPGEGAAAGGQGGAGRQQVKEKAAVRAGLDPQTADTKQVATTLAGDSWAILQDQTRRNPALVGGIAFVLGFLLGR
jgi:hypothetical protein